MKPIAQCRFTAFVSYAHDDDVSNDGWITSFSNELRTTLGPTLSREPDLRGLRLPPMHLSGDNGPNSGLLSEKLRAAIEDSFFMVIVVHECYASSAWCLRELEMFERIFGREGFRERLFIVALSEPAMLKVAAMPAWRRLMPGEQVWKGFFDEIHRDTPFRVYTDRGGYTEDFGKSFSRVRGDMVQALAASARRAATPPPAAAAPASPVPAPAAGEVLLGFVTPAGGQAAQAAVETLAARRVKARLIQSDAMFDNFAVFGPASQLVLCVEDGFPLSPDGKPGGHLAPQAKAWLEQYGKPASSLLWLDLRRQAAGAAADAAVAAAIGAAPLPLEQLLVRLAPPEPAAAGPATEDDSDSNPGLLLYIESNPQQRYLWQPLGNQLRTRWREVHARLAKGAAPPLRLSARALPVDQLDRFSSLASADGVVLLWGNKDENAVVAQIDRVERKIPPDREVPAGIVAYLMPPNRTDIPSSAVGWNVLPVRADSEVEVEMLADDKALDLFFREAYERRKHRLAAG